MNNLKKKYKIIIIDLRNNRVIGKMSKYLFLKKLF